MKDIIEMSKFRWFMLIVSTLFVLLSIFWYIFSNPALGEFTAYVAIISLIAFLLDGAGND